MKRKNADTSTSVPKKPRKLENFDDASTETSPLVSPRTKANNRECKFKVGEKVLGFFGGWPYVGVVNAIEQVRMSFGRTFVFLIRWNGFSGKHAQSWVSEFDVVALTDESMKMKQDMEESQRQRLKEAGNKISTFQARKIFTQVVREFRGRNLAPFRPQTAPYGDEWQTIVRLSAMPKPLVDHLQGTESLMNERKVHFYDYSLSVQNVLKDWLGTLDGGSTHDKEYVDTIITMFNKFLLLILLYKFEIAPVFERIVRTESLDYSSICPVEYLVRLCNVLPQILTCACSGILSRNSSSATIDTLFRFVNSHQSFLIFLERNMDRFLVLPRRAATLDEPAEETCWSDLFIKDEVSAECDVDIDDPKPETRKMRILKGKRKSPNPTYRPPQQYVTYE